MGRAETEVLLVRRSLEFECGDWVRWVKQASDYEGLDDDERSLTSVVEE